MHNGTTQETMRMITESPNWFPVRFLSRYQHRDPHIERLANIDSPAASHTTAEAAEDYLVDVYKVDQGRLFRNEEEGFVQDEKLALRGFEVAFQTGVSRLPVIKLVNV